ncbi:sigma-70 family RNA polymerase sigma factor [Sphingobacterium shayense]|uniref:sigma-70 family RNA polymerase sigma factor n=1 Tax=Sphingobacterium shayense TaxID=626343 RepID=UPI001557F879|nr:sigma-70 family RNA polymerase sigma factor [Sphingobacterium shayense]NQD69525.1 sigma-70 family RNA polymerase sigma factor [Sphingobacterium shayense]
MQHDDQLTETEIINRILAGEKVLYELIVRRFNFCLYKVGRSYRFNHEDTQDLMQDTYVDAFKGLSQFEQRSNFKTWIIRIMLNNCYRKKKKYSYKNEQPQESINENLRPMFNNSDNDANKPIHSHELGFVIEKSVERLPENYRIVFSLREINGLNVSETAEILNISEGNVKVRLNRAKSTLRKELEKAYSASDLYEFNLIYCDAMVDRVMKKIIGHRTNYAL